MLKPVSPSPEPKVITPNPIFKICLLGLPLGIGMLGIASVFLFYGNRNREAERAAAGIDRRLQATFRVPLSEQSIAGYRRTLEEILGVPAPGDLDALTKTANYIEGTLGQSNLGYRTVRSETADGSPVIQAIIEGRNPPLTIAADYTRPGSAAALLALAAEFAGEDLPQETILTATPAPPETAVTLDGTTPLKSAAAAAETAKTR